ncbi:TPA: argininosuccinate synthase [Candidatus Micrarchaeota archaeon]|nr:argininosuccinate synthase [Candidatus Micrarchaeota archaeon]
MVEMDLSARARELSSEYPGIKKVALSYSGGLDSAVVGCLLSEAGFTVHPIVVDIGQQSDFARISKNAKGMFGSCAIANAKEEFTDNIFRAIKAGFGLNGNLNSGGISRPALARALAMEARKASCQAIAHGSSGMGNDHLNMENALRVLAPDMRIMAPVRDLDLRRDSALLYAKAKNLKTNLARAQKYSADENLWERVIRQGNATDPSLPMPEETYKWTVSPEKAPSKAARIEVEFLDGIPVSAKIDGKKIAGKTEIIARLNSAGGKHGVGRMDALDDKVVGLKVREVYECPAARILLTAHRELENITLTTKELDAKAYVDSLWARLVHDGGWHTRLRHALDAFIDQTQRSVDGSVSLELYKGGIIVKGRKSRHALYNTRLSSRDSKGVFSQKDARHFAKLYGLQDIIAYMIDVD